MKPDKKAQELVQKYFDEISDHMTWDQARECAMIAANEVFSVAVAIKDFSEVEVINISYWKKVKEKIETL